VTQDEEISDDNNGKTILDHETKDSNEAVLTLVIFRGKKTNHSKKNSLWAKRIIHRALPRIITYRHADNPRRTRQPAKHIAIGDDVILAPCCRKGRNNLRCSIPQLFRLRLCMNELKSSTRNHEGLDHANENITSNSSIVIHPNMRTKQSDRPPRSMTTRSKQKRNEKTPRDAKTKERYSPSPGCFPTVWTTSVPNPGSRTCSLILGTSKSSNASSVRK
jgi:hypothetical protein